jgi:2,6-dihydroxypyridine 3-monooxygenase
MSRYDGATAAVIGGSIGGLTAALLLRDLGFSVQVFERTPTALDGRGGGIVLQPDTVRWFTERSSQQPQSLHTSTEWVQYLDTDNNVIDRDQRTWTYTSWGTFYRALLADFGTADYHLGEFACGFDQDERGATVRFVSGRTVTADLVVFADGITSTARERLDPTAQLTYSGYVGWRGTVPEHELTDGTRELLGNAISYSVVPHSHITLYPIPGEPGAGRSGTEPGDRLMNYVWYRNVPAGPELSEMLIDKRGIPGKVSLHPGQVQDRYVDEMRAAAARMLAPAAAEVVTATATPYVQVVQDVRSSRMADGRVALIGDAACGARPHAAAGTAKAAADAWALSAALEEADGDVAAALRKWEPAQLELSSRLLDRVVDMGERSQFRNTWVPGDPSLRFGLYGPGR